MVLENGADLTLHLVDLEDDELDFLPSVDLRVD